MVTLHSEGVDWNRTGEYIKIYSKVTLHSEGVDWNVNVRSRFICRFWSPSTRRVWIEIHYCRIDKDWEPVTLHSEGVDWNAWASLNYRRHRKSPSTWRVWIEILCDCFTNFGCVVTLHSEGVDWNKLIIVYLLSAYCHPPLGGCGLKLLLREVLQRLSVSPSTRRVWIEIALITVLFNILSVTLHSEGVDWNA